MFVIVVSPNCNLLIYLLVLLLILVGCLVTYFGFYCDAISRVTWITLTILVASVGIIGPFYKGWAHRSFRKWRTLIYVVSGFVSASPVSGITTISFIVCLHMFRFFIS
jgi:hypothetical protein